MDEGSDIKRYTHFGTAGNQEARENHYYNERPMTLNAWTQTDNIFAVSHNDKNENSKVVSNVWATAAASQDGLLQKISMLEGQVKMYSDIFDRLIVNGLMNSSQNERNVIASTASSIIGAPKSKRMKIAPIAEQQQQSNSSNYYSFEADMKPLDNNSSYCSGTGSTSSQPSVINAAVSPPTDSVKYRIISDGGANGSEEPIEIQLAEDEGTLNLNSSAESGRLEICLSEEGVDIKPEEQQSKQNEKAQFTNSVHQSHNLTKPPDEAIAIAEQTKQEQEDAVQKYLIKRGNILYPVMSSSSSSTTTMPTYSRSVVSHVAPSSTYSQKHLQNEATGNCSSQLDMLNGALILTTQMGGGNKNSYEPILYNQVNVIKQQQQQQQLEHQQRSSIEQLQQQQQQSNLCHIVTNQGVNILQLSSVPITTPTQNHQSQQYQNKEEQFQQQLLTNATAMQTGAIVASNQQTHVHQMQALRLKQTNQGTLANISSNNNNNNTITTITQAGTTAENVLVSLGPNNTRIPAQIYENISWSSASMATRKLLMAVFDRETLATHSMTGKPSPAFKNLNKPAKQMLDSQVIADIIFAVTHKCNVSEKEVRNAITTKCADENKMMKQQELKKRRSCEVDNNKENKEIIVQNLQSTMHVK